MSVWVRAIFFILLVTCAYAAAISLRDAVERRDRQAEELASSVLTFQKTIDSAISDLEENPESAFDRRKATDCVVRDLGSGFYGQICVIDMFPSRESPIALFAQGPIHEGKAYWYGGLRTYFMNPEVYGRVVAVVSVDRKVETYVGN